MALATGENCKVLDRLALKIAGCPLLPMRLILFGLSLSTIALVLKGIAVPSVTIIEPSWKSEGNSSRIIKLEPLSAKISEVRISFISSISPIGALLN